MELWREAIRVQPSFYQRWFGLFQDFKGAHFCYKTSSWHKRFDIWYWHVKCPEKWLLRWGRCSCFQNLAIIWLRRTCTYVDTDIGKTRFIHPVRSSLYPLGIDNYYIILHVYYLVTILLGTFLTSKNRMGTFFDWNYPGSVCLGIQKHKNDLLKNGGFAVDRQFFWMYAVCRNTLLLSLGDIHFHELRVNWETQDFWNCSPPIPTIKNSQSRPTIACYQMVNWSNPGSRKKPNLRIHGTWQRDFVLGIRSFSNFFCCLGSGGKFLGGVFLSLGYLGSSNLCESDDTVSTWNFTCRQVSPAKACFF